MPRNGGTTVLTALRFTGINIPQGYTVVSSRLQFNSSTGNIDGPVTLTIRGELSTSSRQLSVLANNISTRVTTTASVTWSPANWTTGANGANQQTPSLVTVIQEILSQPGWVTGGAIVVIFSIAGSSPVNSATRMATPSVQLFITVSDGL
jgi:hypothetical protein